MVYNLSYTFIYTSMIFVQLYGYQKTGKKASQITWLALVLNYATGQRLK